MNANTNEAPPAGGSGSPRLKALVIGAAVVAVAVMAFFIWRGVSEDAEAGVWDRYYALRQEHEPKQDPLWNDLYGVFAAQRDRYIRALDAFLEKEASENDDALEPEVRWRLAKTLADHILAQRDLTDATKRRAYYDRAIEQMGKIRDDFPDYPLNWDIWKPDRFPSLTRKFVDWLEKNRDWESKYLPSARAPDGEHTVVFQTTAGDVRVKMYATDAKAWVDGFLKRAIAGGYDGTSIFEKREIGTDAAESRENAIRGGSAESRDAQPYNTESHLKLAADPDGGGLLPAEARNLIPHTRGVMVAWHDAATEYDDPVQFMWVVQDSPQFDYGYTPVGKATDDASLATLDRIFERKTWRTDPKVSQDAGEARKILDYFQAPIVIVKVLVYGADGALIEPAAGAAHAARAIPSSDEGKLSTLKADAAKTAEPKKPAAPAGEDDTKKPEDG